MKLSFPVRRAPPCSVEEQGRFQSMAPFTETVANAVLKKIRTRQAASEGAGNDGKSPAPSTPLGKVSVREAKPADFDNVCALNQRLGQGADSRENWTRLWENNPALQEGKRIARIGWVLDNSERIVGFLGNVPLTYEYRGRELAASATCRFAVEPVYRSMSHLLVTAFFRQSDVDLFLNTTATPAAGKIMAALKANPIPQQDYGTVLFWVLQPSRFAGTVLAKIGIGAGLSAVGGAIGSLILGAHGAFRRSGWAHVDSSKTSVLEMNVDELGEEFESFWVQEKQGSEKLFARRTRTTFRWHFCAPGSKRVVRVLACFSGKILKGYAVLRLDETADKGLRRAVIADLMVQGNNPDVVARLVKGAYQCARNLGADVLEILGFPKHIRDILLSMKPYTRKYPACPFFYKTRDAELRGKLADESAWYACPYDGDATLWP